MEHMSSPLFPDLMPKMTDPLWFNVDKPVNDDTELTQLEHEHTSWLNGISQKNCDVVPIGKTAVEQPDEEEDDEEEDNDDDDDSDTHDDDDEDEMDMEVSFDRDSPVDVSVVRLASGSGSVREKVLIEPKRPVIRLKKPKEKSYGLKILIFIEINK